MLDRLFVSMNFGASYTTPNVRASHAAAAARWRAQYMEVVSPLVEPDDDTFRQKLNIPKHLPRDTRVCLVDGDAIIAADCPDMFLHAPSSEFCLTGVANLQDGQPDDCKRFQEGYWERTNVYLTDNTKGRVKDIPYDANQYINGGVLIGQAWHMAEVFGLALFLASIVAESPIDPMVEQTCLNMALRMQATGMAMNHPGYTGLLDPTFNRICTDLWRGERRMGHYVEHFAKLGQGCNGRDGILESIDWRAPIESREPVETG